ncbi:unnamed protein product, partial [Prorocentrum cordatum]
MSKRSLTVTEQKLKTSVHDRTLDPADALRGRRGCERPAARPRKRHARCAGGVARPKMASKLRAEPVSIRSIRCSLSTRPRVGALWSVMASYSLVPCCLVLCARKGLAFCAAVGGRSSAAPGPASAGGRRLAAAAAARAPVPCWATSRARECEVIHLPPESVDWIAGEDDRELMRLQSAGAVVSLDRSMATMWCCGNPRSVEQVRNRIRNSLNRWERERVCITLQSKSQALAVIGSGGSTIRELQSSTQTRIAVDTDNLTIVIAGREESVRDAKARVMALIGGAGGGKGGGGGGGFACFNCGEEGHRASECPNPPSGGGKGGKSGKGRGGGFRDEDRGSGFRDEGAAGCPGGWDGPGGATPLAPAALAAARTGAAPPRGRRLCPSQRQHRRRGAAAEGAAEAPAGGR